LITLERYNLGYIDDFVEFIKEFQQYGDEYNMMGVLETILKSLNISKKYSELNESEIRNIFPKYVEFVKNIENFETLPKKDWVEADFYAICRNGKMIGEAIFRKRLSPAMLTNSFGHISYKIKHSERGKGYGDKTLKLLLENAWNDRYTELSISCKENNIASTKIIEKNGGVFNRLNGMEKEYWFFKPR